MKKFLSLTLLVFLLAVNTRAQVRYLDEVFSSVQVTDSVVYAQNYEVFSGFATLLPIVMDVYQPVGDTATNRPLILLSHNGSFLPEVFTSSLAGLCFNGIKDSSIAELCKSFARRGYVAVSFDYRLGWSATAPSQEVRTKTIIQAVYRAMQDSKALVRYFKNDFANNGNSYGIDTGKIVIGGTNSGAYVALAASSMNDPNELSNPKFVGSNGPFISQDTLGDFEGFGGTQNHNNYPGISSRFQCVLSLGGAIGDTSWLQAGETPIIALQGVNEVGTPYNTSIVTTTTGQPVIEVSGSGDFMPIVNALGNNNVFLPNNFLMGPPNRNSLGVRTTSIEGLYPFYGQYFEPWNWYEPNCFTNSQPMQNLSDPSNPANWASPAKAHRYIDTVLGYTLPRLYKLFVDPQFTNWTWNGISDVQPQIAMDMYPNPARSEVTIRISEEQAPLMHVTIFDITGKQVISTNGMQAYYTTLNTSGLSSGTYLLQVQLTDGNTQMQKLLIEK